MPLAAAAATSSSRLASAAFKVLTVNRRPPPNSLCFSLLAAANISISRRVPNMKKNMDRKFQSLKEYIGANPALKFETSSTVVNSKISKVSAPHTEYDDTGVDEFYDAIAGASSSEDEDSNEDDDEEVDKKDHKVKLKNVSWAITSLTVKRASGKRRGRAT